MIDLNKIVALVTGTIPDDIKTLVTQLSNRLRIDAEQGLNASQQSQGRANLGLGAVATQNTVPVANGGTGAADAAQARGRPFGGCRTLRRDGSTGRMGRDHRARRRWTRDLPR